MQCKWLQCIWKLDIMNGQSVTNNRICGGNVMSQAKIFKLLSEAYGLTWSGGIAAEVIDGGPGTLKEDRCGGAVWCAPRDHQTVRSSLC